MATVRSLSFDMIFRDRATKALKRTDKQMDRVARSTKRLRRGSERLERQQKSLKKTNQSLAASWKTFAGIAGVGFALNAVKELGKEVIGLSAKMELTRVSFETMLGSKERAKSLIADIKKFSLATPFTPDQLFQASQQMLNFGFAQEEIIPSLRLLGDVSLGNAEKFGRLGLAFAQIRGNMKLMGQDNLQLINAGFAPLNVIAGKTGESMAEVRKRMEQGQISFEEVREAFITATSAGGTFFKAMESGSKTLIGLGSTLKGFQEEVFIALGDEALEPLKDLTKQMIEMSRATLKWLSIAENIEGIKQTIKDLAEVLRLTLKLVAGISRAGAAISAFRRSTIGRFLDPTGFIPSPQKLVETTAGVGRLFTPRTATPETPLTEGGARVVIPKLIETVNVNANSREEGQAAARGFMEELDANADELKLLMAQ